MLRLYTDQLDNARQIVLDKLSAFADSFTLAGGTAIMLQICHRKSYDFDCFSSNALPVGIVQKAKRIFGRATTLKTKTPEIVTVTTPEQVEVAFVHYPYNTLKPRIRCKPMPLFHLDDLVSNKAYTLGRRPAWRDYVDLFFFLKWKLYDISTIVRLSEKKFEGEFNAKLFLNQLTYFEDLDIMETVFLKEPYTQKEVKSFLSQQVKDYLKKVLPI